MQHLFAEVVKMNYKYEIVNYDKNIPAKILYCDLSSETHKTELHWHREPEIVYVLDGLGECSHNGDVMDLPAGECKIFNSEDVHLVRPKMGHHANMIIIQLSFEYMRMFCKTIDSVIFDLHDRSEQKGEICEILRQIASIDIDHDEYGVLKQISGVNLLYYKLLKYCTSLKRSSNSFIIPKRDFSYAKPLLRISMKTSSRRFLLTRFQAWLIFRRLISQNTLRA